MEPPSQDDIRLLKWLRTQGRVVYREEDDGSFPSLTYNQNTPLEGVDENALVDGLDRLTKSGYVTLEDHSGAFGYRYYYSLSSQGVSFLKTAQRAGFPQVPLRPDSRDERLNDRDVKQYDVVISFAGEDRYIAERLANELKGRNVDVFYDGFEKANLWGEDLYAYLDEMYRFRARFCVMLLSEHYAKKLWTNHERKAAQARAFSESETYILPIRLDETEIPGIPPTVGHLIWQQESLDSIAELVVAKLGK